MNWFDPRDGPRVINVTVYFNKTVSDWNEFIPTMTLRWTVNQFPSQRVYPNVNTSFVRTVTSWTAPVLPLGTNMPPILDGPTAYTYSDNTALLISDQVLTDADFYRYNQDGLMTVVITATNGLLSIVPGYFNALNFTAGGPTSVTNMTFVAPIEQCQRAVAHLSFTATFNFNMSISIWISDNGNSGIGGVKVVSKFITLTVSVSEISDIKITWPASITFAENALQTFGSVSFFDPLFRTTQNFSVTMTVSQGSWRITGPAANLITDVTQYSTNALTSVIQVSGTLANLNAQMATIAYRPMEHYNQWKGTPVVTINITDSINPSTFSTCQILLIITPVNWGPVLFFPAPSWTTFENTSLYIRGINITDTDNEETYESQMYVELQVSQGTLRLNATAGISFFRVSGLLPGTAGINSRVYTADTAASYFAFFADLTSLGWALTAGLTYTPNAFYNGADSLRVAVSDMGFSGAGGVLWANNTLPITVVALNTAPVLIGPNILAQPLQVLFVGLNCRSLPGVE
jgi:hypothetical protein